MQPKPKKNQIRQKSGGSQKGSQALSAGTGKMLKPSTGMKSVAKTPGGKKKRSPAKGQRAYSQ